VIFFLRGASRDGSVNTAMQKNGFENDL